MPWLVAAELAAIFEPADAQAYRVRMKPGLLGDAFVTWTDAGARASIGVAGEVESDGDDRRRCVRVSFSQ
jgi:hypothetical protein